MLRVTRAQVGNMQKSFQIAVDAAKTIRRTCVSATEHTLLPPTCQAVDYCQWPLEASPCDRLKWRQLQHARVPPLPTVFAPPGFLIERVSLKPVGYVESVFVKKNGCPRQGAVCAAAPARLKLLYGSAPSQTVEGLEKYSHVWLLFLFHDNGIHKVPPMVKPPRLNGAKVGVFASRAPHRPCPIGLTLARLCQVQGDTLLLHGVDLVHGTPILDVKPYVRYSDCPPFDAAFKEAEWSSQASSSQAQQLQIVWQQPALLELRAAIAGGCMRFVSSEQELMALAAAVLRGEPRSVYRRSKCSAESYGFSLDGVDIVTEWQECDGEGAVPVVHVTKVRPLADRVREVQQQMSAALLSGGDGPGEAQTEACENGGGKRSREQTASGQ